MTDFSSGGASAIADAFAALYDLAQYLRSEQGCPWDREQGLGSMLECVRDETAELDEAVASDDADGISEEWGDIVFNLLMFAVIAEEKGGFETKEALRAIEAKMIRRHPHVFGNSNVGAVEQVLAQWERIKAKEKKKGEGSLMDNLPFSYSALKRAQQAQKAAAEVGFDWPERAGILDKIREETAELRNAIENRDEREVGDELGDLLFSCVNLARFSGMDSESLLHGTTDKFIARFKYIESELRRAGKSVGEATLAEMDALWEKSKKETGDNLDRP